MSDNNNSDSEEDLGNARVLNRILQEEGSYWCICGGRFTAECLGDAFLCLYDYDNDMFKAKMIDTSDYDFTWSSLSEKDRDEWKLKNLNECAWSGNARAKKNANMSRTIVLD